MNKTPEKLNQKLTDDLEKLKIFIDESNEQGGSFDQFKQNSFF